VLDTGIAEVADLDSLVLAVVVGDRSSDFDSRLKRIGGRN